MNHFQLWHAELPRARRTIARAACRKRDLPVPEMECWTHG